MVDLSPEAPALHVFPMLGLHSLVIAMQNLMLECLIDRKQLTLTNNDETAVALIV